MRWVVAPLALCAALGAAAAAAAPTPSYTVTFSGAGSVQHVDHQRNIQDSGLCDSAEHVTVTAALAWTTSWRGFRVDKPAGAAVAASEVRVEQRPLELGELAVQAQRSPEAGAGAQLST